MTTLKRAAAALLATSALIALSATASAQEFKGKSAGDIIVRARALAVIPDEKGNVLTDSGVDTGLDVRVDNDYIPEVDFSYFITDNIALELIAGTSRHAVKADGRLLGGASTEVDVGKVRLLPPTLTVQYHPLPKSHVSPYFGAGINYTLFFNEEAAGGTITSFKMDNSFGPALQAGVDVFVTDNILINFDVKKIWINSDWKGQSALGPLKSDVDINPWVVGVGVGYRF